VKPSGPINASSIVRITPSMLVLISEFQMRSVRKPCRCRIASRARVVGGLGAIGMVAAIDHQAPGETDEVEIEAFYRRLAAEMEAAGSQGPQV